MAYALKYTLTVSREGKIYKLNIYEKDFAGASLIMDNLQALRLEVQGASAGIDAPMVKTNLHFTLADEREKTPASGHKCGHWEEFYTPDSTKYRVALVNGNTSGVIWTGYITPDSYSDSLVYNGSVTIVARDNIGHISDFEVSDLAQYTEGGLVSIEDFLGIAFAQAGVAMTLTSTYADANARLKANGAAAHDWMVEWAAIKDMNLYEAAEKILAGAGLCVRWDNANMLVLLPLRLMHTFGQQSQQSASANFVNRSGSRTLDPAYKQIVDKLTYEFAEGLSFEFGYIEPHTQIEPEVISRGDFEVAEDLGWTRRWKTTDLSEWKQKTGDYQVLATAGQAIYGLELAGIACFLTAVSEAADGPWALTSRSEYVAYKRKIGAQTGVNFSFNLSGVWTPGPVNPTLKSAKMASGRVMMQVAWKQVNGTYLYLGDDGVWSTTLQLRTVAIEKDEVDDGDGGYSKNEANGITLEFVTPPVVGELEIRLYDFEHGLGRWVYSTRTRKEWTADTNIYYVMMSDVSIDIITDGIAKGLNTTTIYDEEQNYTLKRDSAFGMVPEYIRCPGTILNGYFTDAAGHPAVSSAAWNDAPENFMPLPVAVHLQLLALHAKPNNILGGTLRAIEGRGILPFVAEWHYAQRKFILQSGQWNLLTGFIDGAQLREFDTYEEAIGVASLPDFKTVFRQGDLTTASLRKAINAVAGGGYAPTGGGGVVGVTSVGLQMPDEFEVENTPITSVGDIVVTLAEGYKIPTEAQLDKLDELPGADEALVLIPVDYDDEGEAIIDFDRLTRTINEIVETSTEKTRFVLDYGGGTYEDNCTFVRIEEGEINLEFHYEDAFGETNTWVNLWSNDYEGSGEMGQHYVAKPDMDDYQEKLIAGSGISIAADGKTISATGGDGVVKIVLGMNAQGQLIVDTTQMDKTLEEIVTGHTAKSQYVIYMQGQSFVPMQILGDGATGLSLGFGATAITGNVMTIAVTIIKQGTAFVAAVANQSADMQEKLIAGTGISIAQDGKTISATGGGDIVIIPVSNNVVDVEHLSKPIADIIADHTPETRYIINKSGGLSGVFIANYVAEGEGMLGITANLSVATDNTNLEVNRLVVLFSNTGGTPTAQFAEIRVSNVLTKSNGVSTSSQTLTAAQKAQVLTNLGLTTAQWTITYEDETTETIDIVKKV